MYAQSAEARRELVLRVFPELRFGGDQDLERYFELRKAGRLGEALSLYNGPLRARYPEDGPRILLLRLYRERDPRWQGLQARLLESLGRRLAARARANIDALAEPLASSSLRTALGALGAVEGLLGRLGQAGGPEGALELLERYLGFARVLGYRVPELLRARDLLGDYLALAAAEAPDEQDFVARSRALEERKRAGAAAGRGSGGVPAEAGVDFIARSEELERKRREAEKGRSRYFDLSRLSFSAAERARIELDPLPKRHEDLVLAYCLKYWKAALDPGFERLVFLYSRKYGSLHHQLYRAIRIGRLRKRSDDEILAAVSSLLSVRYSYSVMGDFYMQAAWKRLKAGIEASGAPAASAPEIAGRRPGRPDFPPAPPAPTEPRPAPPLPSPLEAGPPGAAPAFEPAAKSRPLPAFAARPPAFALKRVGSEGSRPAATEAGSFRSAAAEARPGQPRPFADRGSLGPEGPGLRGKPVSAPSSRAAPPAREAPARARAAKPSLGPSRVTPAREAPARRRVAGPSLGPSAPERQGGRLRPYAPGKGREEKQLQPVAAAPEPLPAIRPRSGSISDRIRRLSGKNYDVYKSIFLERVRDDIRRRLLASRTRRAGIFDTSANEAEDIVFGFMSAHYEDPFMDWEGSGERSLVEELGYALPSLDPIVEACFRRL